MKQWNSHIRFSIQKNKNERTMPEAGYVRLGDDGESSAHCDCWRNASRKFKAVTLILGTLSLLVCILIIVIVKERQGDIPAPTPAPTTAPTPITTSATVTTAITTNYTDVSPTTADVTTSSISSTTVKSINNTQGII